MLWLREALAHGPTGQPTGRPGRLEIESTRETIDVEQFTPHIQPRADSALHGPEIDLIQAHAAARDELVLIESFSNNLQFGGLKLLDKTVTGGVRKTGPAGVPRGPGRQNQVMPEPRGQRWHWSIHNKAGGLSGAKGFKLPSQRLGVQMGQPVEAKRGLVILIVKGARAPGRKPKNGRPAEARVRDEHRAKFPSPRRKPFLEN